MTYNWNTMVEITVPTGTNGWLYSGEVIINGVKVRFPVGVPTSVPEPAAVLLKKMIELEQEEDANTAKPQNHYVGDVTIPAGKTLTLEKGAKFVDNSGGGEVVILPETEIAAITESPIMTAPNAMPEVGKVYVVTYDGTAYDCPAIAIPEGIGMAGVALGNSDLLGISGGNASAPFVVALFDSPQVMEGSEFYGLLLPVGGGEEGTFVTISIVEKAETASAGGGVFYVDCTPGELIEGTDQATLVGMTKTYEETFAAYESGQVVAFRVNMGEMMEGMIGISFISGYMPGFGLVFGNQGFAYKSDGTAIMMNA